MKLGRLFLQLLQFDQPTKIWSLLSKFILKLVKYIKRSIIFHF